MLGGTSFWESVEAFVSREATNSKEGLENFGDEFDIEMTKREAELEATPSERLEIIRDGIESKIDDRLDHNDAGEEAEFDPRSDDAAGSGTSGCTGNR